jgi:hypothetical protein
MPEQVAPDIAITMRRWSGAPQIGNWSQNLILTAELVAPGNVSPIAQPMIASLSKPPASAPTF